MKRIRLIQEREIMAYDEKVKTPYIHFIGKVHSQLERLFSQLSIYFGYRFTWTVLKDEAVSLSIVHCWKNQSVEAHAREHFALATLGLCRHPLGCCCSSVRGKKRREEVLRTARGKLMLLFFSHSKHSHTIKRGIH